MARIRGSKNVSKASQKQAQDDDPYPETAPGEKKSISHPISPTYCSDGVEKSWYAWWKNSNFFVPDPNSSKKPFVMVLPPPDVTGSLHLGHALTATIEDTIIRWRRMSGYNTLWVPATDHAGIAAQVAVEKKIIRERNLCRHDIGRKKFVSEVGNSMSEHRGTILKQLHQLGASLDWSRECFTMDEKSSKAVSAAFIRLSNEHLIYRAPRMVHWDCVSRTAISDIEVEYLDIKERTLLNVPGYQEPQEFGVLTSFAYPLEGGVGEIVVSTTRVETMLGDTAIAVHPKDERYIHLHGKFAIHPFNGRKLPIICDEIVDTIFGSGAVKISPSHDPNDYDIGKRHDLRFINVLTDDGRINSNGGLEFEGMPRFRARSAVVDALIEKRLFRGAKSNEMRLGICSRSKDVVEPIIKTQWFLDCKSMANQALDATKHIEFIPEQYAADWKRWLENISDWCISRQLWWGHPIPAWYVTLHGDKQEEFGVHDDRWIIAANEEEAQSLASRKFSEYKTIQLRQDLDVLDTWFSSALFPLSVLGWPGDTADIESFYPVSLLETGHDVLFPWVARMVMLGMKLGGDVPFPKVYLHPMVCDAHGRKMSKAFGNAIDPLDIINGVTLDVLHKRLSEGDLDGEELERAKEGYAMDFPNGIPKCGADALRFGLLSYTSQFDKVNLDIQRVVKSRDFCESLWTQARFALSKLGEEYTPPTNIVVEDFPFCCRWIVSALNKAIVDAVSFLESYKLSDAATTVYEWWKLKFCETFIEVIKPYFGTDNPELEDTKRYAQHALWLCLDNGLRLLHPFMPFITEELWQRLPARGNWLKQSIMISDYPSIEGCSSYKEPLMDKVLSVVEGLRSRRELLPPVERTKRLVAFILCKREILDYLEGVKSEICTLANLASLEVSSDGGAAPRSWMTEEVDGVTIFLKGNVDAARVEVGHPVFGRKFCPTDWELLLLLKWKSEGRAIPDVPVIDLDLYAHSPVELLDRFPVEDGGKLYIFTPLRKVAREGNNCKREAPGGVWHGQNKQSIDDATGAIAVKRSLHFKFSDKTLEGEEAYLMTEYQMSMSSSFALSLVYTGHRGKPKCKEQPLVVFSNWAATMAAKYNVGTGSSEDSPAVLDLNLPPC